MHFKPERDDVTMFVVSCLLLFFEMLMIRWLSSEIRIFAYFHNLVLLFCFLGMGLGCAIAREKIPAMTTLAVVAVFAILLSYGKNWGFLSPQTISSNLSFGKDFVIWGREGSQSAYSNLFSILVGLLQLLICVCLLTACFIPFGQILGSQFNHSSNTLRTYAVNLLGSLAGIWSFYVLCAYSLSPVVWFVVGGTLFILSFIRGKAKIYVAIFFVEVTAVVLFQPRTFDLWTLWSPYQKLTVSPLYFDSQTEGQRLYGYQIDVNSAPYMFINNYTLDFQKRFPQLFPQETVPYDHYNIAYRFAPQPQNVLIVGSGAGNDVAGALRNEAKSITAVEIDPSIISIGKELHPEKPYQNSRVAIINDDARSFFSRSSAKYDLIVFGLLDSHTLSSSYSNVRLDNYVYTLESISQAKKLLKPDGVLFLIFEISDEYIGARMTQMLTRVFGYPPVGIEVRSELRGWGGYCFVSGSMEKIQSRLMQDTRLMELYEARKPLFQEWSRAKIELTTDDWPYLYLKDRKIPNLFFIIFCLLGLLSYWGTRRVAGKPYQMQWQFFFLGAAFLLLEVQNISKIALLFGTTWVVNTIVVSGVLTMVIFANYLCMKRKISSTRIYYLPLLAGLGLNYLVPMEVFSGMPILWKILCVAFFTSIPVAFAGIIFSVSFQRCQDRSSAFASNLFGSIVGGMLECTSFIMGVKFLLILAAILYILAWYFGLRQGRAVVAVVGRATSACQV